MIVYVKVIERETVPGADFERTCPSSHNMLRAFEDVRSALLSSPNV